VPTAKATEAICWCEPRRDQRELILWFYVVFVTLSGDLRLFQLETLQSCIVKALYICFDDVFTLHLLGLRQLTINITDYRNC